jgi:BirA family transcriptional regulator, biotin operon repressor / biotin---[acetyl-CoA-carboxylase] ligase
MHERLFRALSDGNRHTLAELAAAAQLPVDALAAEGDALAATGLALERTEQAWRLAAPLELLDERAIRATLPGEGCARLRRLGVALATESTNQALLAVEDLPEGAADVLLAEYQSAGRGRQGRAWVAPPCAGLCLSLSWRFAQGGADLAALAPAVGVAAVRALTRLGLVRMGLKWPNDILVEDAKLAGILCELRTSAAGAYVVVGIGMNHRLPAVVRAALAAEGRAVTDLAELAAPGPPPGRNALAAALIGALLEALPVYAARGFSAFHDEWRARDLLAGRPILVSSAGTTRAGLARGVAPDGALRVEMPEGLLRVSSGEVSVRVAP